MMLGILAVMFLQFLLVIETHYHLLKVFSIRGEEPSTKFYIRLDGEFVCKVEVDRGAWGEYDDNPIDVMDWQQIMLEVRKFAGRAFVLHVEIKLNHQLEMTPWTREEEETMVFQH